RRDDARQERLGSGEGAARRRRVLERRHRHAHGDRREGERDDVAALRRRRLRRQAVRLLGSREEDQRRLERARAALVTTNKSISSTIALAPLASAPPATKLQPWCAPLAGPLLPDRRRRRRCRRRYRR